MVFTGDTSAESAIKKAIDDVNNKIAKGSSTSVKPAEGETDKSNNNAASPANDKDNVSIKSKAASTKDEEESPKSAKSVAKSEAKSETKTADKSGDPPPGVDSNE